MKIRQRKLEILKEPVFKLSPSHIKLLDDREAESLAGKNSKKTWEEIKASIILRGK